MPSALWIGHIPSPLAGEGRGEEGFRRSTQLDLARSVSCDPRDLLQGRHTLASLRQGRIPHLPHAVLHRGQAHLLRGPPFNDHLLDLRRERQHLRGDRAPLIAGIEASLAALRFMPGFKRKSRVAEAQRGDFVLAQRACA